MRFANCAASRRGRIVTDMSAPEVIFLITAPGGQPVSAWRSESKANRSRKGKIRSARKHYGPFMGNPKLWKIHPIVLR